MPTECPNARDLADFHEGRLAGSRFERLAIHLEHGCSECNAILDSSLDTHPIVKAARVAPPKPLNGVGTILAGKYKLIEPIGEGGMGQVFMAQQLAPMRRTVAIKLMRPGLDSDGLLARFEAERQALALMDHPNIAKVLDAGATPDGRPFFAMELVKGIPITTFCDMHKLNVRERIALLVDVCAAVQHAHQKGVIHRDLKPGNVLVAKYDSRAVPKVIDFGVVKAAGPALTDKTLITGFGAVVGTLEYMAPEQAELNQLDVDTRADVYSLGVLLYELVTSTTPLETPRIRQAAFLDLLRAIREEPAPRPSTRLSSSESLAVIAAARTTDPRRLAALVRGELDWIILRCLEKDRTLRYETANALGRDLQRYLSDEPVEARPPGAIYRLRKLIKRQKAASVAILAIATAVFIGAGISVWQWVRARDAESKAQAALAASKDENAVREAVQQFLLQKIYAAAKPEGLDGGLGKDVTLRTAIDAAVPAVADAFRGRPLAEAAIRDALGNLYADLGEYHLSIAQFDQAVRLRTSHQGDDHLETLESTLQLAVVRTAVWDIGTAITMLEKLRERATIALGPQDRLTLRVATTLAEAYERRGRTRDAMQLLEETHAVLRDRWGINDADTLAAMNLLSVVYRSAGRATDGIALLEDVARTIQNQRGARDLKTLDALGNLALLYASADRFADAIAVLESVVPELTLKLGPMHPATVQRRYSLGSIYARAGRHDDAIRNRRESVAVFERSLGEHHEDTLKYRFYLAEALAAAGQGADAIAAHSDVLTLRRRLLPPGNYGTLWSIVRLGELHHIAGDTTTSRTYFDEFLTHRTNDFSQKNVGLADHYLTIAAIDLSVGNTARAESLMRDALALRTAAGHGDWHVDATRALLGAALLRQRRYQDAEPLLLAAHEGLTFRRLQLPPTSPVRAADVSQWLVELYTSTNNTTAKLFWEALQSHK